MSATDAAITLACFCKFEPPSGNVLLSDGGFVTYGGEDYTAQHGTFGTLADPGSYDANFGDLAEAGTIRFLPDPGAALADWFTPADLHDSRFRIWLGEVGSDGKTVSSAELLADWLVDTAERRILADGGNALDLHMISRAEKLFLVNEGNVCSQRFHQSVWSGEKGFNNCTDLVGFVAWGAASPPRGSASGGSVRGGPIYSGDFGGYPRAGY